MLNSIHSDVAENAQPLQQNKHVAKAAPNAFVDILTVYRLMFDDWDALVRRQAAELDEIIRSKFGSKAPVRIIDTTCGIGTQCLGLAALGYTVTGCDISPAAIASTRREAIRRDLELQLEVADICELHTLARSDFDVAVSLGNSLPMLLGDSDLVAALWQIREKLAPGGLFVGGLRDYSKAIQERPTRLDEVMICDDEGEWRLAYQFWLWTGKANYTSLVNIQRENGEKYHETVYCRALLPDELEAALNTDGFVNIRWLEKNIVDRSRGVYASGFSQLIVAVERPATLPH
jgi:glycine/sarcosine N-methyltransferase